MVKYGTYKLNNGVEIPKIGFGTWQIPNGDVCYTACRTALQTGYSHIDTAAAYGNEESVGKAVRDSGIARADIFVTSKLPAESKGYDTTMKQFSDSLNKLGVDYMDLYLIHAPRPWGDSSGKDFSQLNIECWRAMEKLYSSGKIRAIGVSNFHPSDLTPVLENCTITPMVNQICYYIGNKQEETYDFCESHDILTEAYSPLATGRLLTNENLLGIAERLGVTLPQLCIKWCIQRGVLPLPKTKTPERITDNFNLDFEISNDDMLILNSL